MDSYYAEENNTIYEKQFADSNLTNDRWTAERFWNALIRVRRKVDVTSETFITRIFQTNQELEGNAIKKPRTCPL